VRGNEVNTMNTTTKRRLRALGVAMLIAAGYAILFATVTGSQFMLQAWEMLPDLIDPYGHAMDEAFRPITWFGLALLVLGSWLALGREGRESVNVEVRRSLHAVLALFLIECWKCGGLMLRKQTMMLLDNPAETEWFGAHVPLHSCCLREEHGRSKAATQPTPGPAPGGEERRRLDIEMAERHEAFRQAKERVLDISGQVRTFQTLGRHEDVTTARARLESEAAALRKANADVKAAIRRRDALDDTAA
jgi:hypothetical protein